MAFPALRRIFSLANRRSLVRNHPITLLDAHRLGVGVGGIYGIGPAFAGLADLFGALIKSFRLIFKQVSLHLDRIRPIICSILYPVGQAIIALAAACRERQRYSR